MSDSRTLATENSVIARLALGSTSLPEALRSRPSKLVDGKAKPCHDGEKSEAARIAYMFAVPRVRNSRFNLPKVW